MLTGELRAQVDRLWDAFWSGGIANPLEVMEQVTSLLFIRRLDQLHTLEERKASRTGRPMARRIFPDGTDGQGRAFEDLRWSRFRHFEAKAMFAVVADRVFPFLRGLGGTDTAFARHMKDARLTIPTPALLARVVEMMEALPLDDADLMGDIYEHMLGRIASAGQNGQFRTPRHIIALMVEMTRPTPRDVIVDPASGTCGFLTAAAAHLFRHHPEALLDAATRRHIHHDMFHGYDFDRTMLRIGTMNMMTHGIEDPSVDYRDSLAEDHARDVGRYSLVLANPPFAGSLDAGAVAKDLAAVVKTRKTELLFIALFLRLLKPGGRAAVVVPDGVLFGASRAHREIRRLLVEEHRLDGVVSLPAGVFRPYAGVSCAILLFTRTDSGGTGDVWFHDMAADGWSLDDKRQPLLPEAKLGPVPAVPLTAEEHARNNLPDVLARWNDRAGGERARPRTAQSFCVPKAEIAAAGWDLSLNRYKKVVRATAAHRAPGDILADLRRLEGEIAAGMRKLEGMLG
ncbi:N-6 DNA methylase [Roseococcus sp. DSY-14]|uniref:type I restriction-modification system subunit M n=1 Tax=Roseococcus sp. DSY-14 TaxID=3369650 RepID=UPI00387AED38